MIYKKILGFDLWFSSGKDFYIDLYKDVLPGRIFYIDLYKDFLPERVFI